jgi:NAD(P)-dependent dehydrogenase (short-subunit alcohol dehydrogenase family)
MRRKPSALSRRKGGAASSSQATWHSAKRRSSGRVEAFGKLDILVNNAAFQEHVNSSEELTDEYFDRTLKTNLYGYFNMVQASVPHMKTAALSR